MRNFSTLVTRKRAGHGIARLSTRRHVTWQRLERAESEPKSRRTRGFQSRRRERIVILNDQKISRREENKKGHPGSPVRNLQIEIHPSASLFSLLSSLVVARHEAGQRPSRSLLVINAARSVCSGNFEKWPARDDSEFCAYRAISCRRTHASVEIFSETGGGVHIAASEETPCATLPDLSETTSTGLVHLSHLDSMDCRLPEISRLTHIYLSVRSFVRVDDKPKYSSSV